MRTTDPMRCSATSHQTGEQCRQRPIHGGTVCVYHGGKARQVQDKARHRLACLVDPAITELSRIIQTGDSDAVKLAAVRDLLDRAGYGAKQTIRHEMEDRELRALAAKLAAETGQPVEAVLAEFHQFAGAAN